jgi:dTMP kinase
MKRLKQGMLVVVEGIDGSGKSTLAHSLFNHYSSDYTTLLTKEPGGSALGQFLRSHLQNQSIKTCADAEFLLFAADRAQHFHERIIPALTDNALIISDRLADSSLVYQGYARGVNTAMIESVNKWVMQARQPDVTIYVKVPLEVALLRIQERNQSLTAFEKDIHFFKKIIDGFDELYKTRENVITLDGKQPLEIVFNEALKKLDTIIHRFEQ